MTAIRQWMSTEIKLKTSSIHFILYVLFFLSGCSALIYQVIWQRMLFTLFGVDLESITIIVSVFMFGLGVGGLCGGLLADRMPARLLMLYIVIEIGIGLFGFLSPMIIDTLGAVTPSTEFVTAIFSFAILAFPTILMGATFPILVTHVNKMNHNIGRSVGALYFANTLGGAVGAYFSGFVFLYFMDIVGAIDRAAALNFIIVAIAFIVFRRQQ
jgi:MFS family permease